eukprot:m.256306 g.256306  ORF g.256306 m.256306 type:complete len:54 (-) comp34239_c0_seq1:239-400(-)
MSCDERQTVVDGKGLLEGKRGARKEGDVDVAMSTIPRGEGALGVSPQNASWQL